MKMVAPRALRNSSLILGVAVASLFLTPSETQAGNAELKAIALALVQSPPNPAPPASQYVAIIEAANSNDLAMAVTSLIKNKPAAKAALFVGEALKRSDDSDFGTVMGQRLNAVKNTMGYGNIFNLGAPTISKFIGSAAKSAATGAAPKAEWVDEFAFQMAPTDQEAYDAAKAAIASNTAVGAIIGSRLYDPAVTTDAQRLALAQRAILAKNVAIGGQVGSEGQGLTKAALEIARAVTAGVSPTQNVDNPATFAADLLNTTAKSTAANAANKPLTQPLLAKITQIAPGIVAGAPLQAKDILESLFTNNGTGGEAVYNPTTKKTTGSAIALATIKNISKLTSAIGLVADTEQYSFIAASIGQRVGTSVIKSSLVGGLAKALVSSMVKKPLPVGASPVLGQARDNALNRADEAAEIAAYLLNAITGNNTAATDDGLAMFKVGATDKITKANTKAATAMVTNIIKSVVKAYNFKKAGFSPAAVAADVAGSVALTLRSLQAAGAVDQDIFNAIVAKLTTDATAKSIDKPTYLAVKDAIDLALTGDDTATAKFENGTVTNFQVGPVPSGAGNITEPETDIRGA